MAVGAKLDDAAPCRIRLADAFGAEHHARRREVRPFDDRHQILNRRLWVVDEHQRAVDDLTHIGRGNVRRHADRNAARAVDEKLRKLRRKNRRLFQRFIVVRYEVHRLLVDILEHELCNLRHANLGIAHRCRGVAVDRTEVAMTVGKHMAHGKVLCHADDSIVDRAVAVRMILTQDFANDTRRFLIRLRRAHAGFLHRVENAPMHRFQAIAYIRQCTSDNDAHRVVDV